MIVGGPACVNTEAVTDPALPRPMSEDYQAPSGAEHPITPPPELLHEWATEYWGNPGESIGAGEKYIAIQAARWGADQELEACRDKVNLWSGDGDRLYAARRPQPPSLADQALIAHRCIWNEGINHTDCGLILRALKRLQELEGND